MTKGKLILPSGKTIECEWQFSAKPVSFDEEFLAEQTRWFNEIVNKFRIPTQIVLDGSCIPSGPVVKSTLTEEVEGSNA